MWYEERRRTVSRLAAMADNDPAVLRRAALEIATEHSDRPATALLLDAAAEAARHCA